MPPDLGRHRPSWPGTAALKIGIIGVAVALHTTSAPAVESTVPPEGGTAPMAPTCGNRLYTQPGECTCPKDSTTNAAAFLPLPP